MTQSLLHLQFPFVIDYLHHPQIIVNAVFLSVISVKVLFFVCKMVSAATSYS